GLEGLMNHPEMAGRLSILPDFSDWSTVLMIFIIPLAVQWWSVWYPGAEPGGGGYIAQRMLAAKDEKNSVLATLWFNVAHYAIRPWPWVIVGLCSVLVYPTFDSIQEAFPGIDPSIIGHDLAYPAMLVFLPSGLLGLVVASLAAAYMSTISTHLNWGASYIVDDFYRRFVRRGASDAHYVLVARISTVALIVLAGLLSLWLENALQAFQILLQIGAGTGLIFLLRWFWWRINAWSEITAMVVSFLVAIYFQFVHQAIGLEPFHGSLNLVIGVAITTTAWLTVTYLTPPASEARLRDFYEQIRPIGPGWKKVVGDQVADPNESAGAAFACWFAGVGAVYCTLFGTGYFLYGYPLWGAVFFTLAVVLAGIILRLLPRVGVRG
ncbi:MAG TPA: Na+:solute symporter, partial [Acidobacteriota bacterium]|nr:Na+:solute symporter [Acidobacteriota bacterium]